MTRSSFYAWLAGAPVRARRARLPLSSKAAAAELEARIRKIRAADGAPSGQRVTSASPE